MGSYCYSSESECPVSTRNPSSGFTAEKKKKKKPQARKNEEEEEMGSYSYYSYSSDSDTPVSMRNPSPRSRRMDAWTRKSKKGGGGVLLEGYVDGGDRGEQGSDGGGSDGVGRTKSLTDEDLEELKGCLDLGFGFSYEEIPELCNTLPALELCYSMSQRFLDEQHQRFPDASGEAAEPWAASSSPIANWKISSPGDHPEEVKARLKYWAQAVACTVRLCS